MKTIVVINFPRALLVCAAFINVAVRVTNASDQVEQLPAASGDAVESMRSYDRLVTEFMLRWKLPGGAVAVTRNGKLVFARGYGWANVESKLPVQPDSLFRLASVSKPITAVAVLALVEQGKLKLTDRALAHLPDMQPTEGKQIDPRFNEVTIEQLLRHTGGWDRDRAFDPMFRSAEIASELGIAAPADSTAVIRYMLSRPLDFSPGQRYSYSNFGYCMLGRVIERVTGQSYEAAVQKLVLQPCGASGMRLGHTKQTERCDGEVCYYMPGDEQKTGSVFPDVAEKVSWPDGGFYLEAMDAHGGWIGSAIDLLRFTTALDGTRQPQLPKTETTAQMISRGGHTPDTDPTYYALGWMVRPLSQGTNWWHSGSLPGTSTLLVHTADGFDWAILLNARPADTGINAFHAALDALMWQAFKEVESWPEHDLFTSYGWPTSESH